MTEITPFGSGDLPQTKTDLYTCPAGKRAWVKHMVFHNKTLDPHRLAVFTKRVEDADSRIYADHTLNGGDTAMLTRGEVIPLNEGDKVQAQSVDGVFYFDYDLAGLEESILATT